MWIKCSDKLPDIGVDVIVWVTEDMCRFDIGRMTTSRSYCEGWDTNHDLTKYRKITHWMPLPTPPKSDTVEAVEQPLTQVKTPAAPSPEGEICPKCGNEMAVLGGSNGFSGAVCVVCD